MTEQTQTQTLATPSTGFFAKIAKAIGSAHKIMKGKTDYERMEDYLADSVDIYDLEARMRAWDKRQTQSRIYF